MTFTLFGAELTPLDHSRAQRLFGAIKQDDPSTVEATLPDCDLLWRDSRGCTALMAAVFHKSLRCLTPLIAVAQRRDFISTTADGHNALLLACKEGATEHALALLPHSDLAQRDNSGRGPLEVAASHGQSECLAALLQTLRPEPVSPPGRSCSQPGFTALMWAADGGHVECARLLLPFSDPLAVSHRGKSALLLAADCGASECARLLADSLPPGAVDQGKHNGRNALFNAVFRGLDDSALDAICRVNDPRGISQTGITPLMEAVLRSSPRVVARMIPLSDVNAQDPGGYTALHFAADTGNNEALELLLPHCQAPRATNGKGLRAYELARERERWLAADLLGQFETEIEQRNLVNRAGIDRAPRSHARLEAALLRRETLAANRVGAKPSAASDGLGEATDAPAPSAERKSARL